MDYTILVADDEKEIRELLRLYLENAGYKVIEAEDGQMTLDLLRNRKIDICLLDIMMPKMDGYHVLQELRKKSNIPVIIISAKAADSEKILGLNLGADDYITKPFNPLEAVARVNSNIRRFYSLGTKETVKEVLENAEPLLLNYAKEYANSFKKNWKYEQKTEKECLEKVVCLFMSRPTKEEVQQYGTYVFCDDVIGEEKQVLAPNLSKEQLKQAFLLAKLKKDGGNQR